MKLTINDPDGLLHAQLQERRNTPKPISLHGLVRNLMHEINTNAQSRGYTNGVAWAKDAADAEEISVTEKNMLYAFHHSRNDDSHGHAEEADLEEEDCLFLLSILSRIEKSKLRADGDSCEEHANERTTPEEIKAWFQKGRELYNKQEYEEAVKYLRMAAENGNDSAQFFLALCHEHARGTYQDHDEAVKWYRMAAEQGNSSAIWNLGVKYEKGQGVRQDYKQAAKLYRQSAELGDSFALYNLGKAYLTGSKCVLQDEAEAFRLLRRAAELGHKEARDELADMYLKGQPVYKNIDDMFRLYHDQEDFEQLFSIAVTNSSREVICRTAELGCLKAQLHMAKNYTYGDEQEELKWYKLAAEQGDVEAQYQTGYLYDRYSNPLKDSILSRKFYEMAAEHGHSRAQLVMYNIERENDSMSPKAFQWLEKAANNKDARGEAKHQLAKCYEEGIMTPKDPAKAFEWYLAASEAYFSSKTSESDTYFKLGEFYANGIGVEVNYKEARIWYKKAKEAGYNEGWVNRALSKIRFKGLFW